MAKLLAVETVEAADGSAAVGLDAVGKLCTELVGNDFEDVVIADQGTIIYVSDNTEFKTVDN